MKIRDVLKQQEEGRKAKFYWYGGDPMEMQTAKSIPEVYAREMPSKSSAEIEAWEVLITKEALSHARSFRRINSCMHCLRLGFCKDIPAELKKEAKLRGEVDMRFKPEP